MPEKVTGSRELGGMCVRSNAQSRGWESGHPSVLDHDSGALWCLEGAYDALSVVLRFEFLPTGTEVRGKTLERRWTRRPRGIL